MKKLLLAVITTLTLLSSSYAQSIEKNDNVIYLGFGFDPFFRGYNKNIGPAVIGYERIITDVIGIGRFGVGGTLAQSWYGNNQGRTSILAKCAYHFDFNVTGLDFYAGVGLGYNFYNWNGHQNGKTNFGSHIYAGVRYFFNNNFGVWGEVGYGVSALQGGVAFKF